MIILLVFGYGFFLDGNVNKLFLTLYSHAGFHY